MTKSAHSEAQQQWLHLKREWPFDPSVINLDMRLANADEQHVLGVFSTIDSLEEACFWFDTSDGTTTRQTWHLPNWLQTFHEKLQTLPEKGVRDAAVAKIENRTLAAAVTAANYICCWEVNTSNGFTIESQHSVQSVAIHPSKDLVAVGTGRWVLDTASPAVAAVELWDYGSRELIDRCRLPGATVASVLWLSNDEGLMRGYEAALIDDKRVGLHQPCLLLQFGQYRTLIAAITVARNQSRGFACLIDPQLMTIVAVTEITDPKHMWGIYFWPPYELMMGGWRTLENFHDESSKSQQDPLKAPFKTASYSRIWLSEARMFELVWNNYQQRVARVWEVEP